MFFFSSKNSGHTWMEPPYASQYNALPSFNRPVFDNQLRFERPPFNRMPFGPRPPFDGSRPTFDKSPLPFGGPRQFDGDGADWYNRAPEYYDPIFGNEYCERARIAERNNRQRYWDRRKTNGEERRRIFLKKRPRDQEDRLSSKGGFEDHSKTKKDERPE